MRRLLSIDWDYFFPMVEDPSQENFEEQWSLYDWGHSEAHGDVLSALLWGNRAADFRCRGLPLPECTGWKDFWGRFKFRHRGQSVPVYLADSHRFAASLWRMCFDEVWNFDAHHDAGYKEGKERPKARQAVQSGLQVTCEDWMVWMYTQGARLRQRYPQWRVHWEKVEPIPFVRVARRTDDDQPVDAVFDAVFVCRSGAWTPPWCDAAFEEFVRLCPAKGVSARLQPLSDRSGWEQMARGAEELRKRVELAPSSERK